MAYNNGRYYNNRNNNYRNNGGHRNNYNRNFNNDNSINNKPQFTGFDATRFRKPNIEIKDLNGKVYVISGNFSTAFSAEIVKTIDKINEIRKSENDIAQFPKMFNLLKEWCLSLINLNVDSVQYTMDDVNAGFNDIYVLYNLVAYISKVLSERKITPDDNTTTLDLVAKTK